MNVQRTARLLSARAKLLQRPTRATYSSQSPAVATSTQPSSTQIQQSRPAPEPQYIQVPPPVAKEDPPPADGVAWTALLLVLIMPPISWYYYKHRKEHMGKKKEELIKLMEEKRAALNKELGK